MNFSFKRITEFDSLTEEYRSESPEAKLCPLCKKAQEDETHFLFDCPMYADFRIKYLSEFDLATYKTQKLSILNTSNVSHVNALAKYVFFSLKFRSNTLENPPPPAP